MIDNFIHEFNSLDIRKAKQGCKCKVCDNSLTDKDDIVYLKSFRLSAQPFHICLNCWKNINELVQEYQQQQE